MFKKQRGLGVPIHGNEGGVSSGLSLGPVFSEHGGEVVRRGVELEGFIGVRSDKGLEAICSNTNTLSAGVHPRTEVEGDIVVCSDERVRASWSKPMPEIHGRPVGPMLLDFSEGKVKPLSDAECTYRAEWFKGLEHISSACRSFASGESQQQPRLKRPLDGGASDALCKKKRTQIEQRQGVDREVAEQDVSEVIGDAFGVFKTPFQETSDGGLDLRFGNLHSGRSQEGTFSGIVTTAPESVNDQLPRLPCTRELFRPSTTPIQQDSELVQGERGQPYYDATGSSNIYAGQLQRVGRPTGHRRAARGSRTNRSPSSLNRSPRCESLGDIRSGPGGARSSQTTTTVRSGVRRGGRGSTRGSQANASTGFPGSQGHEEVAQTGSGFAQNRPGASAEYENAQQNRQTARSVRSDRRGRARGGRHEKYLELSKPKTPAVPFTGPGQCDPIKQNCVFIGRFLDLWGMNWEMQKYHGFNGSADFVS